MSATDFIVVMARYPEPGKTKTRLIPVLGAGPASDLHDRLVKHTLQTVDDVKHRCSACREHVHFAGGQLAAMQQLFGAQRSYFEQVDGDLGDRMSAAIRSAFKAGARRVLVIGTDCVELQTQHLEAAFQLLNSSDVVIGPAVDGGYYLIGLREPREALFVDVDWGSSRVMQQTVQKAADANLSVARLPTLADVDYAEDLIPCRAMGAVFQPALPTIRPDLLSVVIPTFNEAHGIQSTLKQFESVPDVEIIVADGGSTDATVQLAEASGAAVVKSNKGRGVQMNTGAAVSSGEMLLFLHADARLPDGFRQIIAQSLRDRADIAGAFRLQIDAPDRLLRLIEHGAYLRSRWLQLPYGDQALFMRAKTFFEMNGFRNWPLMEDYDLSQRLRKLGRIRILSESVTVSARRWQRLGIVRTTLINQLCAAGFRVGCSPEQLSRLYSRFR